jgi:ankyrin repeat protein
MASIPVTRPRRSTTNSNDTTGNSSSPSSSKQSASSSSSLSSLASPWLNACRTGDIDTVRKYLASSLQFNVNIMDDNGWSGLLWSARNGHTDIVRLLLTYNTPIATSTNPTTTATTTTTDSSATNTNDNKNNSESDNNNKSDDIKSSPTSVTVVPALPLVNRSHANKDGQTALSAAAYHRCYDCVQLVLTLPTPLPIMDVNAANNVGSTALTWAAHQGHFLCHGAPIVSTRACTLSLFVVVDDDDDDDERQ